MFELIESLPQLVWVCSPEGRCEYLSRSWLAYTGVPLEQQQREGCLACLHPDDRARVEAAWRARRLVGVVVDFTQQKLAAEAAVRSHKLEALGTLAGGIAHDFNNILQAIVGRSALALAEAPPASLRAHLEAIARAGARASELVARILSFSRPREQQRAVLALPSVVSEALALVRATIPSSIEVRMADAPRLPAVTADPSEVHQIVVNLATNAAYAIGHRRGLIEVCFAEVAVSAAGSAAPSELLPGRYVRLSVRDDGAGMDGETLGRVFDPYFTTKPVGEGTGLGLAVVNGIMRGLCGAVTVHSQPGSGTTFHLYFPASDASVSAVLDSALTLVPRGAGERVLFVDDEPMLAELGQAMLSQLGYDACCFEDPASALDAFRTDPGRYAVLVTDLSMPRLTGFDVAQCVRSLAPDTPVLMMSGNVSWEDQERALALGVRRILLKPASLEELARALDAVLREPSARGA